MKKGHVSEDGLWTLTEVECMGNCATAPMVQINDDNYEDLSPERLDEILGELAAGKQPQDRHADRRQAHQRTRRWPDHAEGNGRRQPRLPEGLAMSIATILIALVVGFIAWKVLIGLVKFAALALIAVAVNLCPLAGSFAF